jgi:hypothetical protein
MRMGTLTLNTFARDPRVANSDDDGAAGKAGRAVARPAHALLLTVGSKLTMIAIEGTGAAPVLKIVKHSAVALAASQAAAASASAGAVARLVRAAARQVVDRARLDEIGELGGLDVSALRAEGLAQAVVSLEAPGRLRATVADVRAATAALAASWAAASADERASSGVESMMIASAVLSTILESLGAGEIVIDGAGNGAAVAPVVA